jgi:hypothetical protein
VSSIVFPPTLAAAKIGLTADDAVTLHRARKTQVGGRNRYLALRGISVLAL